MRFIADINITQTVITSLRRLGHDVLDIKKLNLRIPDIEIIKLADEQSRIILTHDKDFESYTQHTKYQVGVILIRLKKQDAKHHFEKLRELLKGQKEENLKASLTILKEDIINTLSY